MSEKVRINSQIRVPELRVLDDAGKNLGVMPTADALAKAEALGLDLIEISAASNPPIAKITDYGKFQYEQSKKQKKAKQGAHQTELKTIQVKIGTGEHDLSIKAKNASAWLKEGHRIRVDLFLAGRAKYMEEAFLRERLNRILILLTEPYKVSEAVKRGPKGLSMVIERAK